MPYLNRYIGKSTDFLTEYEQKDEYAGNHTMIAARRDVYNGNIMVNSCKTAVHKYLSRGMGLDILQSINL